MARGPSQRLRDLATILQSLATAAEEGRAQPEQFDAVLAHLRGLRREVCGHAQPSGSAKSRLRGHLIAHVGEILYGEELAEASGILEWGRRVRELREEGLEIVELGGSRYRLERLPEP